MFFMFEIFSKKDLLSYRDLYEQYWGCRDFEIKNLWQRSIFLGTFLVLCFTGYGAFFGKVFLSCEKSLQTLLLSADVIGYHVLALFLIVFGELFSVLWIAMAKASKAWVEVYEKAICVIEQKITYGEIENYASFGYHFFPDYRKSKKNKFDTDFLTMKGGCFSPSRINILLGLLAVLVWGLLELFHLCILFRDFFLICCGMECCSFWVFSFSLSLSLIILQLYIIFAIIRKIVFSRTLEEKDPGI